MKNKINFWLISPVVVLPFLSFISCSSTAPKETKNITSDQLNNFINWNEMLKNFTFKNNPDGTPSTNIYDLQSIKTFKENFTFEKYKIPQTNIVSNFLNVPIPFFTLFDIDVVEDVSISNVDNDENFASFIFNVKLNGKNLYKYTGKNNFYSLDNNISISIANNSINSLSIRYGVNVRIGDTFSIEQNYIENGVLENSNLLYNNQNTPISVDEFIANPQINFEKYIFQPLPVQRNGWEIDFTNSVFAPSGKNKNILLMKLVLINPTIYPGKTIIKENIRVSGFKVN
ncbi:MAG: hypothetical protein ACRCRP_02005 [Metamycoplasmataceae bacterium]